MGATEEQEIFFEKTIGDLLRPLGININADYVHTGYVSESPKGFDKHASHVFLRLRFNLFGGKTSVFWEASGFRPVTTNYLNNWDYTEITMGNYCDGVETPADAVYGYADSRKPMLVY